MIHQCPVCHSGTVTTTTHMSPETDGTHHWYVLEAVITRQSCACPLTDQQEYTILDRACDDETYAGELDALDDTYADQAYERQRDRAMRD